MLGEGYTLSNMAAAQSAKERESREERRQRLEHAALRRFADSTHTTSSSTASSTTTSVIGKDSDTAPLLASTSD